MNGLGHLKDVFNKREDEFLKFFSRRLVDHVDDGLQGGGQHLGTLKFTFHGGQYVLAPQFLCIDQRENSLGGDDGTVLGKDEDEDSQTALINLLAPQSPRR